MNVYHKEFNPEFIKDLPVDFEKMKNMDLSKIPSQYHLLFTTDWNWGRYSTMEMSHRMILQEIHLDYLHETIKKSISPKSKPEDKPVVGFIRD